MHVFDPAKTIGDSVHLKFAHFRKGVDCLIMYEESNLGKI